MEIKDLVPVLEKIGYTSVYFETADEAKNYMLSTIEKDAVIGMGGSVTVNKMGVVEELHNRGNEIYSHSYRKGEDPHKTRMSAIGSDYFLCSANAITENGTMVNIDGVCNRIAAMCYGPKHIIYVIGKNKLTSNVETAIKRIKECACPPNARRLQLNTPCGVTGKCADCNSPQRMCRGILIAQRPPREAKATVILVNEEMGY